jgi:aerobic carbon-monoxide dehydrogenase medium subunit
MYSTNFDYYRPTSVAEAVALLQKNQDAKVLAGGHSLLPAMKLRAASPAALVDIGGLKDLMNIEAMGDQLRIGAMARYTSILNSDAVKTHCPVLVEAAAQVGDVQVRNRGTIGGSLAHADPGADFPTVILALGGTLTAMGPGGSRDIPADQFFTDLFTTALKLDELLTAITVPATGRPGMGGAYLKHRHPASGYAVVGVAALVGLKDDKCERVSLAVGGVTNNPVRVAAAEAALNGEIPWEASIAAAAEKVGEITATMSDVYASSEYRAHLAKVLAKRALMKAVERAKG